jgi:hypothetical protein
VKKFRVTLRRTVVDLATVTLRVGDDVEAEEDMGFDAGVTWENPGVDIEVTEVEEVEE